MRGPSTGDAEWVLQQLEWFGSGDKGEAVPMNLGEIDSLGSESLTKEEQFRIIGMGLTASVRSETAACSRHWTTWRPLGWAVMWDLGCMQPICGIIQWNDSGRRRHLWWFELELTRPFSILPSHSVQNSRIPNAVNSTVQCIAVPTVFAYTVPL